MAGQLRRLMLAAAGLWLAAPVLAGVAGHGGAALLALIACTALVLAVTRPWLLPRWLAFLGQLAGQAAIITVLYLLGFGLARVLGGPVALPLWLPPALALAPQLLLRLVWTPQPPNPEMEAFLDDALAQLKGMQAGAADPDPALDAILRPVAALPPETPDATAQAAVTAAMAAGVDQAFTAAERLAALLDTSGPCLAGRRGTILWGTDPAVVADDRQPYPMTVAFEVTWSDPALLALFARRALPVVQAMPDRWEEFPGAGQVEMAIDDANGAAANTALAALAAALRAAAPAETPEDHAPLPETP